MPASPRHLSNPTPRSAAASPRPAAALGGLIALLLLAAAGCGTSLPSWPELDAGEAARARGLELVERSVEAHGGDLYDRIEDLSVAYEGRWGRVALAIQPEITDGEYRKSSEERLLVGEGIIAQLHSGPGGEKKVYRDRRRGTATVDYSGEKRAEDDQVLASALVADVYQMAILGPSFFLHAGENGGAFELSALAPGKLDGSLVDRVAVRLVPGLGFADADRAILSIDRESGLLTRIEFTLEGYPRTQGADVDIVFSEHREIGGYLWPTHFVERIRAPVRAFAHEWRLLGLDLDRGFAAEDLDPAEGFAGAAAAPAARL